MSPAKRDRNRVSKQVRQERQAAARQATRRRKQRRGAIVSVGLATILGVFGVLGSGLVGKAKRSTSTTETTIPGATVCPRADGSSPRQLYFEHAPGRCIDATKRYEAVIETTAGSLTAELYPDRAFEAVNNFVVLARYHFYDGLPFHRILKDTFAQTGDPIAPGITGPGYEFFSAGLPATGAAYKLGAVVYAHEAGRGNGSQFLIITGPLGTTLEPVFPLFGQVTKGLDVLGVLNGGAGPVANDPATHYGIIGITVRELVR